MDPGTLVNILLACVTTLFGIIMKVQHDRLMDKDKQLESKDKDIEHVREALREEREQGDKLIEALSHKRPIRGQLRKEKLEDACSAVYEMTGEIRL